MKKIVLLLVLSVFLVSACAQQKTEDLVGKGTPVPQEVQQQVPAGDKQVEEAIVTGEEKTDEKPSQQEMKEFVITAKQFAFEPSTIEVNKGDRVKLIVTSLDVPHGIKIAEYGINERLEPGKPATIEFTADKEGTFTVFCSVFCGSGHSGMKGKLVVR
ncbi:MAG: cupredoxin domain-containing protein [Nanoarchaeota archaeon]